MADKRIIIVGSGPAGVRAAEALVAAGLRPTIVAEERQDGGQIYRRQPEGFARSKIELYGSEASRADALHKTFERLVPHIDYLPGALAWNVADRKLHIEHNGQSRALAFDALIICAGATDRLLPVPGWNAAGVYSLGGAQIALKAQACAIGKKVAFLGTGPLLYLVAAQYVRAGANVAAVLDTASFTLQVRALPKLLSRPLALMKGVRLKASLLASGTRVLSGITPQSIDLDDDKRIGSVTVAGRDGRETCISCDAVAIGYHIRPETQLADLAGCEFVFDATTRQWLPRIDDFGRTTCDGVYLAGDGAYVTGADGAETAGQLAACAALDDLSVKAADRSLQARLLSRMKTMRRFAHGLTTAFPWPSGLVGGLPDHTMICRCENISAGELRAAVKRGGTGEINRTKAFSRVGMGRCQGRYCGHAAAELAAQATGLPVEQVGRIRGQAPVKPLAIATTAETK